MWYSINRTNGIKLNKLEKYLILPLLRYMLKYKQNGLKKKFAVFIQDEYDSEQAELEKVQDKLRKRMNSSWIEEKKKNEIQILENLHKLKVLKYACARKKKVFGKSIALSELVDEILDKETYIEIQKQIYYYYSQKGELKKKIGYVNCYIHPDEWVVLFKVFFYEKFFAMDGLWKIIDGECYTREDFHNNFKTDNHLAVCPYCDSDTIYNTSNMDIEHFWPESKYPYLAINPLNLYSSCQSCNRPAEGKGIKVYNPIVMPFYKEIGRDIHFVPKPKAKKINVKGKNIATDNYIKMLNLEKRYSKEGVYSIFESFSAAIYTTINDAKIKGTSVDSDDVKKYVEQTVQPKIQPLYFVISDIFKDYK